MDQKYILKKKTCELLNLKACIRYFKILCTPLNVICPSAIVLKLCPNVFSSIIYYHLYFSQSLHRSEREVSASGMFR